MTSCISTKYDGYILRMGAGDLKAQVPGMGGTLDAIRERMKSIQAAAAGNTGPYVLTCANGLQARMERLKNGPGLDL